MQNFRLAIIGNESSILLYKTFGAEGFSVVTDKEAKECVEKLFAQDKGDEKKTPLYAIIFVEEDFYKNFPNDLLEKLAKKALPAVIPVPTPNNQDNFSDKRLRKIVERAIGSDILS